MTMAPSKIVGLFRWASETGAHGMPRPAALEAEGWVKVQAHPFWAGSWLMMKRDVVR